MPKRSLIHGHGINDADYKYRLTETIGGKTRIIWQCPIHSTWKDLMRRCFSSKLKELRPHYNDVTVCDEWLRFSNFKSWIDTYNSYYDVDGNLLQLDKDLLIKIINIIHLILVYS